MKRALLVALAGLVIGAISLGHEGPQAPMLPMLPLEPDSVVADADADAGPVADADADAGDGPAYPSDDAPAPQEADGVEDGGTLVTVPDPEQFVESGSAAAAATERPAAHVEESADEADLFEQIFGPEPSTLTSVPAPAKQRPAARLSTPASAAPAAKKLAGCWNPVATADRSACPKYQPFQKCWAGIDYVLWWTTDGGSRFPLVTTGDPAVLPAPGSLDQPSTRVLFGGSGLDHGAHAGVLATVGGWLDEGGCWGVEASAFLLPQQTLRFTARSDGAGNPPIYVPAYQSDPALAHEGSVTISDALLGIAGGITIAATSTFWGAEVNSLHNLARRGSIDWDFLFGFRYLDLEERLTLDTAVNDLLFDIQNREHDDFHTRSQFYSGQLGTRVSCRQGPVWADLLAKVALGSTHHSVTVSGTNTQTGTGAANGVFPGGIFAQPSNIGRQTRDTFGVVPQGQVRLGVEILRNLNMTIGYDVLFWSDVVRPGDQIDHRVNQTQQLGGPLVGPATPVPLFERTDLWLHGVSFGLELRY